MTAGLSLSSLHCPVVQCSARHLSGCDFPRGITASKITYIDLFHYFQPDAKWRKTQRRIRECAARRSLAAAIPQALEVRGLLNPVWEKSLSSLQTFHGKCSATFVWSRPRIRTFHSILEKKCSQSLDKYRIVPSKWEFFIKMRATFLLSPSFITNGRMGASKAALILMKNSYFDRTLQ